MRTVTDHWERVRRLTGDTSIDATHRFTLGIAVVGARLLGRPHESIRSTFGPEPATGRRALT